MLVLPYTQRGKWRSASQIARLVLALVLVAVTVTTTRADDKSVVAAAGAFEQGQQAELSGNHERAAELFELADRIAPTPEALRSATRARLAANQLAAAAGNADELLRRYERDAASRDLAVQVLTRAKPELTRFTFQCSDPCTVVVDGLATAVLALRTQVVYVTPGQHNVVLGFEGDLTRGLRLSGAAGEARTLKVARPPPAPAVAAGASNQAAAGSANHSGLSARRLRPAYFWVAASLTVATGAVALWSGLDLLKARDEFKSSASPTRAQFTDGEDKDLRTTVLLGATGALLLTAATLGVFTDFHYGSDTRRSASLDLDQHGARFTLRGSF
ncbi:MAG: hypothetical protein RLZZ450_4397 [Pseudomonadota bacterium]|jgi:hypothetical protein